jgi:hypothetical protein
LPRGIDGLYVHGDALIWIQNGVEPARVVQARLDWRGAAVHARERHPAGGAKARTPRWGSMTPDLPVKQSSSGNHDGSYG